MISEKTVELNLTTEWINYLSSKSGFVFYALAPSQNQESKLGFDASVQSSGTGFVIQYKRAYVKGSIWTWHLNRTKNKDQHSRLQMLESLGIPVYYGLPFFHTPNDVANFRRKLLLKTFWLPPSYINPSGGSTGHHEILFDSLNGSWSCHSNQETGIQEPPQFGDVVERILRREDESNLTELFNLFNNIVLGTDNPNNQFELDESILSGVSVLVKDQNYV